MMRERTKGLAFGIGLLIVTFALGEAVLRGVQYFRKGTSLTTLLPEYRATRFQLSPFLTFGPRIDWQIPGKPNPETAYFNAQGFRTRERLGAKPVDEVRIIALGGSTTEEVWNEEGLHWPLWTERTLRSEGQLVRVYNSGMSAYTSAHTLIRVAFDVLDMQPDIVIVMDNINDLAVNYRAAVKGETVDGHYRVPFARKEFTGDLDTNDVVISRLGHLVWRALIPDSEQVVPSDYDISRGLAYFKRNLGNIHALVSNAGTVLVLLTMPLCGSEAVYRQVERDGRRDLSPPVPESFDRFRRDFTSYNDAIREVAAARHVMVVDMNTLFGDDERWFADIVHYNAVGSRRFGEILATELAPLARDVAAKRAGS